MSVNVPVSVAVPFTLMLDTGFKSTVGGTFLTVTVVILKPLPAVEPVTKTKTELSSLVVELPVDESPSSTNWCLTEKPT